MSYGRLPAHRSTWINVQRSAKDRGLELGITKGQALVLSAMDCFYCGTPPWLLPATKTRHEVVRNGIDRLDNARGYVPDNVVPCCRRCNWAKGTDPLADFEAWLARVRGFRPEAAAEVRLDAIRAAMADTTACAAAVVGARRKPSPPRPVVDSLGNRFPSVMAAGRHHGVKWHRITNHLSGRAKQVVGVTFAYEAANDNDGSGSDPDPA